MGAFNNLFTDEIDGPKLSQNQLLKIHVIFDALQNEKEILPFSKFTDLLGRFVPPGVIVTFFTSHKQSTESISLDLFERVMRFLLNGTNQDKTHALFIYYAGGKTHLKKEHIKKIVEEQEKGTTNDLEPLFGYDALQYDVFEAFFLKHPKATFMSTWLLKSHFTLLSLTLPLPTKIHMMSLSSDIPETAISSLHMEFRNIAGEENALISLSLFKKYLQDQLPDFFITSLFNFFDLNHDGYIDSGEFFQGVSTLCYSTESKFSKCIYRMFSKPKPSGATFDNKGFEHTVRRFVPPHIIPGSLFSLVNTKSFASTSDLSSWPSENLTWQYLVKFIKAVGHTIFGPPPRTQSEANENIMIWLYYIIQQKSEPGSQWYIASLEWQPSTTTQKLAAILQPPEQLWRTGAYHPVSMYQRLITTSLPHVKDSLLNEPVLQRNRLKSLSCEEDLSDSSKLSQVKLYRYRRHFHWFSDRMLRHRLPGGDKDHNFRRSLISKKISRRSLLSGSNSNLQIETPLDQTPVLRAAKSVDESLGVSRFQSMCSSFGTEDRQDLFVAVDWWLSRRIPQWYSTNPIPIPSYLVLYAPDATAPAKETLEIHPLKVLVRWTAGVTLRVSPAPIVNTASKGPKATRVPNSPINRKIKENMGSLSRLNRRLSRKESEVLAPSPGGSTKVGASALHRDLEFTSKARSVSASGLKPACIFVLPQKLSAHGLYFAFSRCHSMSEVSASIIKLFQSYLNSDLTSDNFRIWFVNRPVSNSMLSKPYSKQWTGTHDEVATNKQETKHVALTAVNLEASKDQQLAEFLATQIQSSQHVKELLDPMAATSETFEFVVECKNQFLLWPLGQQPREGVVPLVGLKNMGNTCYLNSVIQCLHMTPSLTDRIRKHLTPETKLSKKYIKLMDKMEKKEHMVLCPQALRSVFVQRCPQFNSFSQQDAQEFLTILIDLLNEELKKKATSTLSRKISAAQPGGMHGTFSPRQRVSASSQAWENFCLENDSPVTSTFYGLFESRCQFRDCGHESSVFDPFSSLTLPFPMAETHLVTIKVVPFFGAVPEIVHVQTSGPEESSYVRHELSRKYSCLPTQLFFCVLSKGVIMKCSIEPELPGPTSELWAFILSQRPPLNREKLTSVPSKILTIVAQNRVLLDIIE
uniref:ubiquitinyl hydrolase 1 n=1 Tax=Mesocestoides corti TaxID=53468 RepID=A0A5K3F2J5_MESCO